MVANVSRREGQRLQREIVVSSTFAATNFFKSIQALPNPFDDVSRDYGTDIYEKMMFDSQVNSNIALFKASVIEEGITVAQNVTAEEEDGFKKSKQIADEFREMLEYMESPLDEVLWDMLDSLVYGSKVGEKTFFIRDIGNRSRLDLRYIKPKPISHTHFVVDDYNNVIGLLGLDNKFNFVTTGPINLDNIIPREKFLIFTFRPKNSDPRGTSILRAAYGPWWRKQQLIPEYLKYLAQFAGPSILAKTPENAEALPDEDTGLVTQTAEEQLKEAILDFKNSSVLAVAHDTEIELVKSEGNGEAFMAAFTVCNFDITKAILTQELATEQSKFQARAASEVHQGILDTLIRQSKRSVVRAFKKDVVVPWVIYNFGEEAAHKLCPIVTLGTTEQRELAPLMTAVAALERAGFISDDQRADIDKLLGLPVRTKNEPNQIRQMQIDQQKRQEKQTQQNTENGDREPMEKEDDDESV